METAASSEHLVSFKSFELDLYTRELRRNGRIIKLHGHPIDVLAILLERHGQLVTREELRRRLWPEDTFVDFEQILNNSISVLRDALGDRAEGPRFIETLPRLGYRFIAPITNGSNHLRAPEILNNEPVAPKHSEAADPLPTPAAEAERAGSNRRILSAATAIVMVVILAVASVVYIRNRQGVTSQRGENLSESALQIHPVTNGQGSALLPALSPDEREIAFLWDGPERNHVNVYVLLLGADTPLRLTDNKDGTLGAPVWSPDGREIAFSRCDGKDDGVYIVPALGGTERRLTHVDCPYTMPASLAWLSGGLEILMVDHCPETGSTDLVVFSLTGGKKRCLTHSGTGKAFGNVFQFSVSPDRRTVAFTASANAPCQADLYTIPLSGGEPHQITAGGRCFADVPRTVADLMWTPDSKTIVFVSRLSTLPTLFRVSANGGVVQRETFYPAIGSLSRDGRRIIYSDKTASEGSTIWRADVPSPGRPAQKNRELIRTQFFEMSPQPSPDGTQVVWRSDRMGNGEIWMSGAGGEKQIQLTHLGWYSGTPRWSPDGKWISFNRVIANTRQIFIINTEGTYVRQITNGPYDNIESSWSRDGKWIYFASIRSGSWQIWRHSLEDGTEIQLTNNGGFDPFESYDGHKIYFSKFYQAGIWVIPASGGKESLVVADKPQIGYWGYWGITKAGLYILNTDAKPGPRIEFYDFMTGRISPVLTLAKKPWPLQSSLSATADGKTIYYTLYDQQSVIKMMEISR